MSSRTKHICHIINLKKYKTISEAHKLNSIVHGCDQRPKRKYSYFCIADESQHKLSFENWKCIDRCVSVCILSIVYVNWTKKQIFLWKYFCEASNIFFFISFCAKANINIQFDLTIYASAVFCLLYTQCYVDLV